MTTATVIALLVLLNNFLHDFSAAGWLFGTVLLGVSLKRLLPRDGFTPALRSILQLTRLLMRLSLLGIVIFGIIRTLAYRSYEWSESAGYTQVTLLIVKHVIFTIFVIPGIVWYVMAGKILQEKE